MRRLRRSLRPVRSGARRARARLGDLGALLNTRGVAFQDIRWVARTALARDQPDLAERALLELVRLGKASAEEQRLLRRLADERGAGAPGRQPRPSTAPEPSAGVGSGSSAGRPVEAGSSAGSPQLLIWRDRADAPLQATLVDPAAGVPADAGSGRSGTVAVWRTGWRELPRSLADELAIGLLTRVAVRNGVTTVRADDPSSAPLAEAVTRAVRDAGRPSAPTSELIP
ncbi:hypothetical protein AB0J86_19360 [Micromonospora sp. NPDC049559]|uniref:hypothetical protein n=1 Tax=Micromonospora sp. NPDC049559 TaxID=3155923 RepID=UPI003418926C